jgi:hypothetical protein
MDWPKLAHAKYHVREQVEIPHESNMGVYTPDELRRLVAEYEDYGYEMHAQFVDEMDCGVVSGHLGRITINLYLTVEE